MKFSILHVPELHERVLDAVNYDPSDGYALKAQGDIAVETDPGDKIITSTSISTGLSLMALPFLCNQFRFNAYQQRYAACLSIAVSSRYDFGYMRDKMEHRLGESWIARSLTRSGSEGMYVDEAGTPLVVLTSRHFDNPGYPSGTAYSVAIGTNGAADVNITPDVTQFSREMAGIERVANALVDSCLSTGNAFKRMKMPSVVPVTCLFDM